MEDLSDFGNRLVGKLEKLFGVRYFLLDDIRFEADPDIFFKVTGKDKRVAVEFAGDRFQRNFFAKREVNFVQDIHKVLRDVV